jgi:hypothetical protein
VQAQALALGKAWGPAQAMAQEQVVALVRAWAMVQELAPALARALVSHRKWLLPNSRTARLASPPLHHKSPCTIPGHNRNKCHRHKHRKW